MKTLNAGLEAYGSREKTKRVEIVWELCVCSRSDACSFGIVASSGTVLASSYLLFTACSLLACASNHAELAVLLECVHET